MDLLKILDGTPEPSVIDLQLKEKNASGTYNLPTPMYEFQKELTDQIVSLHYPDILKFSETDDLNDLVIKSLEICSKNCVLVSLHPYLLIDHYMPKNLAQKDMLAKLAETSGKFSVLKDFINVVISSPLPRGQKSKNVAIVLENNPRLFDLIESVLLGCKTGQTTKRLLGNTIRGGKGRSTTEKQTLVHLIPADGAYSKDSYPIDDVKFDLVFIFDSSVQSEAPLVRKLRNQNRTNEAVAIRLVPMKAVEHCQYYYKDMAIKSEQAEQSSSPSTASQKLSESYLYRLISSIVCLREHIGILPPDLNPIYNHGLNYFSLFVKEVLEGVIPAWPLPELPDIPPFSPEEVERSLLTEAHFHYTPYDSTFDNQSRDFNGNKSKRDTYYEHRKQMEYVTNPNKNFTSLLGIVSTDPNKMEKNLTHGLFMRMNTTYLKWKEIQDEHDWYLEYNSDTRRDNTIGRRLKDTQKAYLSIIEDVDHARTRISAAEKRLAKKTIEIEAQQNAVEDLQAKLKSYISDNDINMIKFQQFYQNQSKIWNYKNQIQEKLNKIQLKISEREYMATEALKAKDLAAEFTARINQIEQRNEQMKREILEAAEVLELDQVEFTKKRSGLQAEIELEKERNKALRTKLSKSWRFLRQTSHLKKRKGRSGTPNK